MSLTIRPASVKDALLIADISHQTFYETFAPYNSADDMKKFLSEQFTKGKLMLEVGPAENIFLLAYYNDEIAGYVKLRDSKRPENLDSKNAMEIARLYAMTHMIGKGIGSALMQASIDLARQKNKEMLWLGVWEQNQRAIDFYIRWAFEKFDETDFLLGDDVQRDWLMKRRL
jgi:ribosomal protein S18 acetylase RimI-like enzyme